MYDNKQLEPKFLELDFGDGEINEISKMDSTQEKSQLTQINIGNETEEKVPIDNLEQPNSNFIELDFGDGETNEISKMDSTQEKSQLTQINIGNETEEKVPIENLKQPNSNFIELDFGDEETNEISKMDLTQETLSDMETNLRDLREPTQLEHQEQPIEPVTAELQPKGTDYVNTVVFFVPAIQKGLLIYNQSPNEAEARFAGFLPEGKFYASHIEAVDFDPSKHSKEFNYINTPNGEYLQQVIMVDEKIMIKIALQGIYHKSPEQQHKRHLFIVDINDEERNYRRDFIDALYEEENLASKEKELLQVIRGIAKTEKGQMVIGKMISSTND